MMIMATPGVKRKNDLFRDIWIGEYVQIGVSNEGKGIMTEGYVLEVDDNEIHLGETAGAVTHSIPRHGYKLIACASPQGEYGSLLESLLPPKPEEVN